MTLKCSLCKEPALEDADLEFEGGNNAEFSTTLRVCETHWNEYEKDEWAFRDKYGSVIDDKCYEDLVDYADHLRDRAKYEGVK